MKWNNTFPSPRQCSGVWSRGCFVVVFVVVIVRFSFYSLCLVSYFLFMQLCVTVHIKGAVPPLRCAGRVDVPQFPWATEKVSFVFFLYLLRFIVAVCSCLLRLDCVLFIINRETVYWCVRMSTGCTNEARLENSFSSCADVLNTTILWVCMTGTTSWVKLYPQRVLWPIGKQKRTKGLLP